jgi:hypothetical protein
MLLLDGNYALECARRQDKTRGEETREHAISDSIKLDTYLRSTA